MVKGHPLQSDRPDVEVTQNYDQIAELAFSNLHKFFSNIALVLVYNFGSWGHEPRRGKIVLVYNVGPWGHPYAVVRVCTNHFSNIALVLGYNVGSWGHEPRRGEIVARRPTITNAITNCKRSIIHLYHSINSLLTFLLV